jgi:hypothetical protein
MSALDRFTTENGVLYVKDGNSLRKPTIEEELLREVMLEARRMRKLYEGSKGIYPARVPEDEDD